MQIGGWVCGDESYFVVLLGQLMLYHTLGQDPTAVTAVAVVVLRNRSLDLRGLHGFHVPFGCDGAKNLPALVQVAG
jgi:hypothetical protein